MAYIAQITADDENRRLDRILRKALPNLPLSAIHKMLRKGQIYIDGKPVPASFKPQAGSMLEIPGLAAETPETSPDARIKVSSPRLQSISRVPSLDILFENEALMFINKKPGIPIHGDDSLDRAVQSYLQPHLPPSLSFKPGPLHRLDQGTSGIIAFSKNLTGAQRFSEALREQRLEKWYITILQGYIRSPVQWKDLLIRDRDRGMSRIAVQTEAGKEALTTVYPLFQTRYPQNPATLVLIKLGTGRTHQIRAQAAGHGYPLLGDIRYKAKRKPHPWLLHAYALAGLDSLQLELPESIQAPLRDHQFALMERLFAEAEQRLFIKRLRKTPPLSDLLDAIIK